MDQAVYQSVGENQTMKIVVLNGSPKGNKSNTFQITDAFLKGMQNELNEAAEIKIIEVYASNIEHCKGCFGCWASTQGKCVIHDDMDEILPKMIHADLIIWSFPLYYYGMPSKLKALLDRNLPLNLPFMSNRSEGGCTHPPRYERHTENIFISTCGFSSIKNNYEALLRQFDLMFGNEYTKILCPEGELFAHAELRKRTDEYLTYVEQAGEEYAGNHHISEYTREKLGELLYEAEAYKIMADASWNIQGDEHSLETKAAEPFTRQMAAMYNRKSFDGVEKIFEIYYTDVDEAYQLVLGKDNCEVRIDNFTPYTTRVETPLNVWQDIAKGIISGEKALMSGKYKILGDFKLLISWNHYFGIEKSPEKESQKKTNMLLMLLPWLALWTLLPIDAVMGSVVCICITAVTHFAHLKWELTIYDSISCLCVSVISILALLGYDMQLLVPFSYLSFGLMWLFSCFTSIPLSAHYSKEQYNGKDALKSKLFIKTNLILSACWGVLYLITPIWTYFIMNTSISSIIGLVNSICPFLLGLFTNWFQKWYPSHIAKGRT